MTPFISALGEVSYKYNYLQATQSQVQSRDEMPGAIQRISEQGIKQASRRVV